MIAVIHQLIYFCVILGTYGLMLGGYMDIRWSFLLSLFGIFVGYLIMFYLSVCKSPEFSQLKIRVIKIMSLILTVIIMGVLIHLVLILII